MSVVNASGRKREYCRFRRLVRHLIYIWKHYIEVNLKFAAIARDSRSHSVDIPPRGARSMGRSG